MIDLNAPIVPGRSIGNIIMGKNISDYIQEMYYHHAYNRKQHSLPNGIVRTVYTVDEAITVVTDSSGVICSLGCNENYKGTYQNRLHPGQTLEEIVQATTWQRIFNGLLIIDTQFTFVIPKPYDETAVIVENIPRDVVFNEIYIVDFSSWCPRRTTR